MDMPVKLTNLITGSIVMMTMLLASGTPGQAAEEYPADLSKKQPAAFHAFQKIVLPVYAKAKWVYQLFGTASPYKIIDFEGKKFVFGEVCKPHDCADNNLKFLSAVDGSAAFALLKSTELTRGKDVILGKPNEAAKKILAGSAN